MALIELVNYMRIDESVFRDMRYNNIKARLMVIESALDDIDIDLVKWMTDNEVYAQQDQDV